MKHDVRSAERFGRGICVMGVLMLALGMGSVPPAAALTMESGDFLVLVDELKDLTFAKDSGLYVGPEADDLSAFANLAAAVRDGDVTTAETLATNLDYELFQFTDDSSSQVYLGLREELDGGVPTRGWGSFFFNRGNTTRPTLVEAPHPRFDTNSPEIAARAFIAANADGLLMAGAHRNANGLDTADVAHLEESIFQTVHEVWIGPGAERDAWSIHGFDLDNHGQFPDDTDVVLSSGDGGVSQLVLAMHDEFEADSFVSYAFNTLAEDDPLNVQVNGNEPGSTFSSLGGTTNEQGQYTRGFGGNFLHIEMGQSIRFDAGNRVLAGAAIGDAIIQSTPEISQVPLPSAAVLGVAMLGMMRLRRRRSRG